MAAIGSVGAVLRSLQTAQDVGKAIREAGYVLSRDDMRRQLADLSGSVSEAKLQLTLLKEALDSKDEELRKLERTLSFKQILRRRGDGYYKTLDGRPYGQPYCSYCWESEHKAIHLHSKIFSKDVRQCPHCKNEYQTGRTPYLEADRLAI
ncbi:hypothetical protein CHH28_18000 [Bacterioplanes sanyensis]|uniref:Uncharacterized protein n=1 Tax=Bacterioplanes sanyensis TaxID=1249553 RepID=A0A222FP14_9GAMM|nr:hypothetical protein [Bacterioplanes sanyensis]ASP40452.1 hypothetical protein CHH28_18000 [Bacterioplanes sanyensis]